MKFLDDEQRRQIGFSFLMEELDITTFYGVEEKKKIKPFKVQEKALLIDEFDNLEKVINSMKENEDAFKDIGRILCKFKDIRNSIKRAMEMEALDEVELYEIKYFSMLIEELKTIVDKIRLDIKEIEFFYLTEVLDLLDPEKKRIPTFHVYDKYSQELKAIREKKKEVEKKIYISDDEDEISKLKQQRLEIVILEEAEELKIRQGLSEEISKFGPKINKNLKSIGKLDLIIAKGRLALKYNAVRPTISDNMKIELDNAFNPEIKSILSKKSKKFTPVSVKLKNGTTVITGANMGGKSVTLKTIVLNLFLGQMGFFVFAEKATFPVLDFIHFISDDMQSISKGLSTFGAEIIKLKEVVECAKRADGFIALDEFARGTNPKEGFYLVKSLATYLSRFNSVSLISTHYDGVVDDTMDHYQVIGLKNMDFDKLKYKIDLNKTHSVEIIQEHMEYKLEKVSKENKVPKDALNIAMLLGLESDIVDIAKAYYNEEDGNE